MADMIREAPLGQIIRYLTGNRYFRYPEEEPDFVPEFDDEEEKEAERKGKELELSQSDKHDASSNRDAKEEAEPSSPSESLKAPAADKGTDKDLDKDLENDREKDIESGPEASIKLTKTQLSVDGKILVTWYGPNDPANPLNWSKKKKAYVSFLIWIYTFSVYASSSIYTSSEQGIQQHFGVEYFKASLGLALFVLGYGIGPLIFSPLSEVPVIGRNIPYISTFFLFVILSIPTAFVNDLGGLLFLRFLQGFFGSPCLATGAASMQDIYDQLHAPIAIATWTSAAFSGPALGPAISGFAVMAKGWRWSLYEIIWMSAPVFICWLLTMPETLPDTILLRRARRLRAITGDQRYLSLSEIKQSQLAFKDIVLDALVKPFEINLKDPAIAYTSLYSAIIYAIYYSFFEVFPIVYSGIYGFNIGEVGLTFICVAVALAIALFIYLSLIIFYVIPTIRKNGMGAPEDILKPAIIFIWFPVISLFGYAWTSRHSIPWIVPTIFLAIYPLGAFIVMQGIFGYLGVSYPKYAASLFAFNDFVRSLFAFGCVLFARSMYIDLGVGKGVSLVGGLSVLGPIGLYLLILYGPRLRARSKFSQK